MSQEDKAFLYRAINSKPGHLFRTFFINVPLFCFFSLVVLLFSLITFFQAREMCMQYILRPASALLLYIAGIRVSFDKSTLPGGKQVVYVGNHQATYDIGVLCACGLPSTRHFMTVRTLKILPLTIIGKCIGIFYIEGQHEPEKRTACFKRAEAELMRTGESVFLSPEGTRVTTGEIGKFNRGSFHMAINMQRPIVPIFIGIPDRSNPARGFIAEPGTISVKVLDQVDTAGMTANDVDSLKEKVRAMFVEELKKFKDSQKSNNKETS